jgi:hypothetical protein
MNRDERRLLLTIGRVVRTRIRDEISATRDADLQAIDRALEPFSEPFDTRAVFNQKRSA